MDGKNDEELRGINARENGRCIHSFIVLVFLLDWFYSRTEPAEAVTEGA
jgi:hypothetical protein